MDPASLRRTVASHVRAAVPTVRWLALFGSQARGDARHESDVDVAMLAASPVPAALVSRLRSDLELAIGRDVHLIDLRAASPVLRSQVVHGAEVLFTGGDLETEQFLDFVVADYARLNDRRAEILRQVRERGRVHDR
ncbi:MAG: nucleotidyltransferase domain-containing protein [Trueperaceae bacterium]